MKASRWLANPAALAAVAGLAVNDHFLKSHFGNWLTGKLSDVFGVFLFPLIVLWFMEAVWALLRRSQLRCSDLRAVGVTATLLTAVGFGFTKLYVRVAETYGDVVGALRYIVARLAQPWFGDAAFARVDVVTDWTDLLVLPVLLLTWLQIRRVLRAAGYHGTREATG